MVGVQFISQSFVSAITFGGFFDPFNFDNAFSDQPNAVVYKGLLQHYPVFQPLGNVCLTFGLCNHIQIDGHPIVGSLEKHDCEISSTTQADLPLVTMNVVPVSLITRATTPWTPTPTTSTAQPSPPIHATWSTDTAFAMAYNPPHTTSGLQMMSSSISPIPSTPRPKTPGGNVTVESTFFDTSTATSFGPVTRFPPLTVIPRDRILVCSLAVGCILALVGLYKSLATLFQPVSQIPHASCKYRYISKRRKVRHIKKQQSRRRKAAEANITRHFQDLLRSHGTPVTYPSLHAILWKKYALEALFDTEALKIQHEKDSGRLEYWQSLATRWHESYQSTDAARLHSDMQVKTFKGMAEELQIAAKSHEKELKETKEAVDLTWDMKEAIEEKHDDLKRAAKAEKAKLQAEVKTLTSSLRKLESHQKDESSKHQNELAAAQDDVRGLRTEKRDLQSQLETLKATLEEMTSLHAIEKEKNRASEDSDARFLEVQDKLPESSSLAAETAAEPGDGEEKEKKKKRPRRNPTHRPTQFPYTMGSDERQAPAVAADRKATKNPTPSLMSSVLSDVANSKPWLSSYARTTTPASDVKGGAKKDEEKVEKSRH